MCIDQSKYTSPGIGAHGSLIVVVGRDDVVNLLAEALLALDDDLHKSEAGNLRVAGVGSDEDRIHGQKAQQMNSRFHVVTKARREPANGMLRQR